MGNNVTPKPARNRLRRRLSGASGNPSAACSTICVSPWPYLLSFVISAACSKKAGV
jgi:hypothetical protein